MTEAPLLSFSDWRVSYPARRADDRRSFHTDQHRNATCHHLLRGAQMAETASKIHIFRA
ncbi:hypothetical protein A2U01_0102843, partial [Trifolium medium]|nr:hypothetical protein [Trifolium medium]